VEPPRQGGAPAQLGTKQREKDAEEGTGNTWEKPGYKVEVKSMLKREVPRSLNETQTTRMRKL